MSKFKYTPPTADRLRKRQQELGGRREGFLSRDVTLYKPRTGMNYLRILPGTWEGADHYGYDVWVHYDVGDGQAFACPAKMRGKRCPICEEAIRAAKKGDSEYAQRLRPNRRVLVYVIDRDKEDEGLKVWSMPTTMDTDLTSLAVDQRTGEVFPIDDPEEGYDIEFEREGEGRKTKYKGVRIARRPSPLGKKSWLQEAIERPLPSLINYYSYDKILAAFVGTAEDDEDQDEDGHGAERVESGGRRRVDEDDDGRPSLEDDEAEEADEEEEEEETRSTKAVRSKALSSGEGRKRRTRDEEEDEDFEDELGTADDEDEDEDEDGEEEAAGPGRRSRGRARKEADDEFEDFDDAAEDEEEKRLSASRKRHSTVEEEEDDMDEEDDTLPRGRRGRR